MVVRVVDLTGISSRQLITFETLDGQYTGTTTDTLFLVPLSALEQLAAASHD